MDPTGLLHCHRPKPQPKFNHRPARSSCHPPSSSQQPKNEIKKHPPRIKKLAQTSASVQEPSSSSQLRRRRPSPGARHYPRPLLQRRSQDQHSDEDGVGIVGHLYSGDPRHARSRDCCFLATGILDADEDGMAELGVAGARAQLCRRVLVAAHQQGDDGGVSVGQIQQLYLALGHRGDQAKASSENMMCDPVDPHIFQYVVGPIKRMKSWEEYMGKPMGQTVPDTCTLVACTVCVEAMHRVAYETYHGRGTFGCTAAAPRKLRRACRRDKIWTPKDGAAIEGVLDKMKEMGGVVTTRAAAPAPWLLPLKGWKRYEGGGLTQEQAADLLDHGPCLASVWTCPWWWFCTSSVDNLVYRGRGTNLAGAMYSIYLLGIDVDLLLDTVMGHHAVVCYGYRICAASSSSSSGEPDEMHVLVMDNQDESGPSRWVDYIELIDIVTVTVERLQPPLPLRRGCRIEYPPLRRC